MNKQPEPADEVDAGEILITPDGDVVIGAPTATAIAEPTEDDE